jgi:hypothetical protein
MAMPKTVTCSPAGFERAGVEPACFEPAGCEPAGFEPVGFEPVGFERERLAGLRFVLGMMLGSLPADLTGV